MSWKITRQDFLNFFLTADTNRDGHISMKELRNVLREYGYKGSDSDINVMFHTTDIDGDNLISLDEYWRAMGQHASRKHVLDVFVRVFRRNDENKDGVVTLKEFRKAMDEIEPHLTKAEYKRLNDMIPLRKRKDFEYAKFKLTVSAVWNSLDQYIMIWKELDKNKDGEVELKDIKSALVEQGYPPKVIDAKFKDLEKKDDKISYDEYISVMSDMPAHMHKVAFLRKAFERFDADGSGTISKTELQKACESLGKSFTDRQIKHIMSKADADQSGELEYEEFAASIEEILAQEDAYETFFRDADTDDSGYLTIQELITALRKGGYKGSDDQIRKMFHASDYSADRKISFDEYMVCMGRSPPGDYRETYMRRIFNEYDRNGDGTIDKKEMKSVFKELGKIMSSKELDRLMKMVDKDGSGSIDYEEFITAMCHK